jgi:hypothetical protein
MAMKKTSVVIPLSGRVPGRASGPSRSRVDDSGGSRCVSGKVIGYLGFSHQGGEGLYRRRGSVRSGPGGAHHRAAWLGPGPPLLVVRPPLAPFHLLFGSLEALVNFWMFGFCFVQFQEYFLCNLSKTQK